jgi:hypothetical protein
MADIGSMLQDLARGQENLAQLVATLTGNVDRVVAGLAIVGQDIQAQRGEIREQRDEIREHRKEAGELRLLIGRVLDRLDRLVEHEIVDLRRRIERLERG